MSATKSYLIDFYKVAHYAMLNENATDTAEIQCYSGDVYRGCLMFVDDNTIPSSEFDINGDFVLYYSINYRFAEILNTFKEATDPVLVEVVPSPDWRSLGIDSAYISRTTGVEHSNHYLQRNKSNA